MTTVRTNADLGQWLLDVCEMMVIARDLRYPQWCGNACDEHRDEVVNRMSSLLNRCYTEIRDIKILADLLLHANGTGKVE